MSGIELWLNRKQSEIEHDWEGPPAEPKKVTVRLESSLVDKLDYVADKTMSSRTRTAEELIEAAINEAYEALMVHPFFSQLEVQVVGDRDVLQALEEGRVEVDSAGNIVPVEAGR